MVMLHHLVLFAYLPTEELQEARIGAQVVKHDHPALMQDLLIH